MKVGSLVVCVDNENVTKAIVPALNEVVYTIRELEEYEGETPGVRLEEILNTVHTIDGKPWEPCYMMERFREVCPPMDNVEEYIKENSLELQEL